MVHLQWRICRLLTFKVMGSSETWLPRLFLNPAFPNIIHSSTGNQQLTLKEYSVLYPRTARKQEPDNGLHLPRRKAARTNCVLRSLKSENQHTVARPKQACRPGFSRSGGASDQTGTFLSSPRKKRLLEARSEFSLEPQRIQVS